VIIRHYLYRNHETVVVSRWSTPALPPPPQNLRVSGKIRVHYYALSCSVGVERKRFRSRPVSRSGRLRLHTCLPINVRIPIIYNNNNILDSSYPVYTYRPVWRIQTSAEILLLLLSSSVVTHRCCAVVVYNYSSSIYYILYCIHILVL